MTRTWSLALLIVVSTLFGVEGAKRAIAQNVILPIENIPQETDVWCWAAVAQQIVLSLNGPQRTPPQCGMVAIANNAHPRVCCDQHGRFNGNPVCRRTGSLQQIQGLIHYFGGRFSSLAPPAHPRVLLDALNKGYAIILQVKSSPWSGHVVVLRGMSVIDGQPVLHINDPLAYFTQPISFQQLLPYWAGAIVVR